MTTSLEELDPDVQQQLREHWGVDDLGSLTEPADDTDYDAVMTFFEEQLEALRQEAEAVNTRVEYVLSMMAQYVEEG
ncbi:hypothetical protein SAMN05192558_10883 [Actinokineospora alba]|uniref:Uncharacterized protein n=1 Tax=Actinokineospora alba TaxID=504798 RepID=A0A1H0RSD9_9PSEU|nr:hypothetical protein [Actinokineospora alba]TDP66958.1 hypothetical protein C8E96_2477 [Actinokineospora alba]SDJ33048.1 hypothetical protein SAMN05421871_11383 [Actinokineospora alba]SDP31856.1 hypothetical protein SAMN05192558_10883 [Actinokineospora alba]